MSVLTLTNTSGRTATSLLGGAIRGAYNWVATRLAFQRTLNELQGLSERELADLGLERSMLPRIAKQAAYDAH